MHEFEEPDLPNTVGADDAFRQARDQGMEALGDLLQRYVPRLSRWASGRLPGGVRGEFDTMDLVQHAITGFLAQSTSFDPNRPESVLCYLRQSVANRLCDIARMADRRPTHVSAPETMRCHSPSPYEQYVSQDLRDRFETALGLLNERERAAVILHVELDESFDGIATSLGIASKDAARMLVRRSLAKLAKEMGRGEG